MHTLLTRLDSDRRRDVDAVSHKFVGQVERLFAGLPKPAHGQRAALTWVIDNQLGRRNATPEQKSYLRGKRYNLEKKAEGRPEKLPENQEVFGATKDRLAEQYGVAPSTIEADAEFAEGLCRKFSGGDDVR